MQGSQPWAVQLEARAKWDAWAERKGMAQDDAKKAYVAEVLAQIESLSLSNPAVTAFPPKPASSGGAVVTCKCGAVAIEFCQKEALWRLECCCHDCTSALWCK